MRRCWLQLALLVGFLSTVGCSVILPIFGYPPHAARSEPPPDIETRAAKRDAPAPDVTLQTTAGEIRTADTKATLAVFFFRGHWCPYCRGQLEEFNAQRQELEKLNITLVGVSADPPEETAELRTDLELHFALSSDAKLDAIRAFGVLDAENEIAWPALFVIRDGQVAYRWIAEDKAERLEVTQMMQQIRSAVAKR